MTYPDVPVSEDLFMKLPLWSSQEEARLRDEPWQERADALRRWIFHLLLWFENSSDPKPPVVPGQAKVRSATREISARRLFTYLGPGATPTEGLQRMLRLTLPAPGVALSEDPCEMKIQDIWNIVFSRKSRPRGVGMRAPALTTFCKELLYVPPEKVADAKAGGAQKGKAPPPPAKGGGNKPSPAEEEAEAPVVSPEEATFGLGEKALLRHLATARALCTHGALLCRPRVLVALFANGADAASSQAGGGPRILTSAEAAVAKGLASMVPKSEPASPLGDDGANPEVFAASRQGS